MASHEMDSRKAIDKQLAAKKVKRDVDVTELYLGECNLKEVHNLSRFKNLKYLWLNENKLRSAACLRGNLRLSELYLQHNALNSIVGALAHLTTLKVLFLHNNQLRHLESTVRELSKMQHLVTLNMFNNPIAQHSEYRLYVVHYLPSVQLLDRHEVEKSERDLGWRLYEQERDAIKETIAFGRRSEGPPSLYYPRNPNGLELTKTADFEVGNNFYRNNPPYSDVQQAVNVRAMRRSVMQYSSFDWGCVPRAEERRTSAEQFHAPQIITTQFR